MTTTRQQPALSPSQVLPVGPRGRSTVTERPYSVRDAAALLGVSQDAIEANYRDLEGFRVGRRILIPRHAVDRLVTAPNDQHDQRGEHNGDPPQPPAVERVLALLPLLARDERVKVAQVALSAQSG